MRFRISYCESLLCTLLIQCVTTYQTGCIFEYSYAYFFHTWNSKGITERKGFFACLRAVKLLIKGTQNIKLQCFYSHFAVVFAQSIGARWCSNYIWVINNFIIQIKICAEYTDMLPNPGLVWHEPGLRPIGLSPDVPDKFNRGLQRSWFVL